MTSLLLVGCGGTDPTPGASSTPTPTDASTESSTDSSTASSSAATPSPSAATESPAPTSSAGSPSASDEGTDTDPESGSDDGSDGGSEPGLEMPEAPEPTVDSLSELLDDVRTAPLVTAPLPRAADARGRLVTGFPGFLRPTRASRVASSSVSPSGPRLQVALVGSTALAPADVLVAYRTRLAGRGLSEQAAPATSPGSTAAAFRRGRSVVTITATSRGSGTDYSVHASLHAGGE